VSLAVLAFKEYPRWAWNAEGALHARFMSLGESRAFGEFNLGQNMDRGVKYGALGLPGLPTPASAIPGGQVASKNEMGGFIRLEQGITRWTTLAVRYDYYSPDTAQTFNGRHTGALVGVVHFTRQLQLMVEGNYFIDDVHAAGSSPAGKQGEVLSTVLQVRYP
jgi:hypothetical protein